MKRLISILLSCIVLLSGCVGKPSEEQNKQGKTEGKSDGVIHLYTLKDNEKLWQTAELFKDKYPEYQVVIDVGVSEENGITVSDAIRSLNTELMAKKGPDVILLDGLPMEGYIEKGVLEDLSSTVKSLEAADEQFFEHVLHAYEKDDRICAVPAFFSVPVVIGKEGAVNPDDVKKISGTLHRRTEEQIKSISNMGDMGAQMLITSWNDVFVKQNKVDSDALSTLLEEIKILYDALYIDLDLPYYQQFPPFESVVDNYPNYGGDGGVDMLWKKNVMSVQSLQMGETLAQLKSVDDVMPVFYNYLNEENGKQFIPQWTFGVSASSGDKEAAKAFVSYFLSAENMNQYDSMFSVNKTSFQNVLPISEEKEQITVMYPDKEAKAEESVVIRKITPEEAEEFTQFLDGADTKAVVEPILFKEIMMQAKKYVYGEESLEKVKNAIIEKVEIYQAE